MIESRLINSVQVNVMGEIGDEELSVYLTQIQSKQRYKVVKASFLVDGEYIDVKYEIERVPFERIRRITGYLVGTTARWGNGKRAEERDRVKHA